MKSKILILFLIVPFCCFAKQYINPIKTDEVNEIWDRGGLILESTKQHHVAMYHINSDIKYQKVNFFFVLTNTSDRMVNFTTEQLQVTDQFGQPIYVLQSQDVKKYFKRKHNRKQFWTAVCLGLAQASQPDEGVKQCTSYTTGSSYNRYTGRTLYQEQTNTLVYDWQARDQQIRRNQAETTIILDSMDAKKKIDLEKARDFYFANTSLYPHTTQGFNFQIEIPTAMLPTLTHLHFKYLIDGEEHRFVYQVFNGK